MFHPYFLWLIASVILLAAEVVTGAYVALSFGVACAGVAIVEAISNTVRIDRDLLLFAFLTIGAFFALRRIFGHKGDSHAVDTDINRY